MWTVLYLDEEGTEREDAFVTVEEALSRASNIKGQKVLVLSPGGLLGALDASKSIPE